MEPFQIRVPTESLRALLKDLPEVQLKLESFACEKIAEEIMRKASSADLKTLTEQTVKSATDSVRLAMKDPTKWPADLQAAIKALCMAHLKDQRVAMIQEFSTLLRKEIAEIETQLTERAKGYIVEAMVAAKDELEKYRDDVKAEARRAFFEVLAEAKAAAA